MHSVTDGPPGKLMGNEIFTHQLLVQRFGNVVFDHQGMTGAQTITGDKLIIHFRFNVHQRLVDTNDPGGAGFIFRLDLLQERIARINGKVVFGFTFTGKFHGLNCMKNMGREW